jgi:hypothetical protein
MCTTAGSVSAPQMRSKIHNQLSTNTIGDKLTTSNTPSRNVNTSTNQNAISNSSPLNQVSIGNQSLSSISYTTNNSALLETFVEYRTLKRDLQRAMKLNETWKADYQVLARRMQALQNSSFLKCISFSCYLLYYLISFLARPSTDGRAFLEQLLDSIRSSDHDEDNRSSNQLANDIGIPETTLLSFSNAEPQKTALKIFSALFPNNEDKEYLVNVANLDDKHPTLLKNILGKFFFIQSLTYLIVLYPLVFSRRCAPGCGYTMGALKDAIGNSIRCARYKLKTDNSRLIVAAAAQHVEINPENAAMELMY